MQSCYAGTARAWRSSGVDEVTAHGALGGGADRGRRRRRLDRRRRPRRPRAPECPGGRPVGTANDFASAHGLPDDPAAATELAVRGTKTRSLELAWMGDRPFVNAASAGLAPAAAPARRMGSRARLGPARLRRAGASAGRHRREARSAAVPRRRRQLFAGEAWQATVASRAFGGGAEVAGPILRTACSTWSCWRRDPAVARAARVRAARGTLERQDGVISHRGTAVDLEVPPGTPFNVDGEIVESGPTWFTVKPAGGGELIVG